MNENQRADDDSRHEHRKASALGDALTHDGTISRGFLSLAQASRVVVQAMDLNATLKFTRAAVHALTRPLETSPPDFMPFVLIFKPALKRCEVIEDSRRVHLA